MNRRQPREVTLHHEEPGEHPTIDFRFAHETGHGVSIRQGDDHVFVPTEMVGAFIDVLSQVTGRTTVAPVPIGGCRR